MPSFIVQLIVDRINRFVPVRTRTISRIEKSIFQNSKNRKKKFENPEISRLTIENEKGEKVLWQLIGHGYPPSKTDSVHAGHRIAGFFRITADP